MELQQRLAKLGNAKGLCQEWHDELLTLRDKEAMCDMYLRGIDFCLSNNYPTNTFIKENFGDVATKKGIYVDKTIDVTNHRKCVCLGETKGKVKVNGYEVCEVFLKHDSEVSVIAKDKAFVMIDIFDNATVLVSASNDAKVCINQYGGYIVQNKNDKATIKIRVKKKTNY